MLGFWEALENATKADLRFDTRRQAVAEKARVAAHAFYDAMIRDEPRLAELGVEVRLLDRTVSFRRNGYTVLSVDFGVDDGARNRIVSAVAVHLKLDPSYEEVSAEDDIGGAVGRWLGLSVQLIAKNPDVFSRFGLT